MQTMEAGKIARVLGGMGAVAGLALLGWWWWPSRHADGLAGAAQGATASITKPAKAPLFETISLKGKITTFTANWSDVPHGLHHSDSVPFECEGAIRLAGRQSEREGKRYPAAVLGVPIRQRARQIHVLQASEYGWSAPDGVPYGKMVVHYEGSPPFVFYFNTGEHGVDWYVRTNQRPRFITDGNTKVGWLFERPDGTSRQLFHTIIANPHPEQVIRQVDFISTVEDPNLFVFGLTLGNEEVGLRPPQPTPAYNRLRQTVTVWLLDEQGQPMSRAQLAWQVESRSYHMTFPPFAADDQGRVVLDLPRRNLMKINYSASAPGEVGAAGTLNSDATGTFPAEVRLTLIPGGAAPLPSNPSR